MDWHDRNRQCIKLFEDRNMVILNMQLQCSTFSLKTRSNLSVFEIIRLHFIITDLCIKRYSEVTKGYLEVQIL